ncbi:MAG: PD-(D/E)XK nuclease family protein [Clostridiales bacterium]|nr:PD-(D/E)XK nuclease family protein [Clostridiales bacterium]
MVTFVYGRAGAKKSTYLFDEMKKPTSAQKRLYLVPAREEVNAQHSIANENISELVEVVTFSKLCNYVFLNRGGLCENYITPGMKKDIMYGVVRSNIKTFKKYNTISKTDTTAIEKLVAGRKELRSNLITPEQLHGASERLDGPENVILKNKFEDLALIYSLFDKEVEKKWKDPDGMMEAAAKKAHGLFKDCDIYIDSFSEYSNAEYLMLDEIFESANNIYVVFSFIPEYDAYSNTFMSATDTERKLGDLAKKYGKTTTAIIHKNSSNYTNIEMKYLAENVYKSNFAGSIDLDENDRHIFVTSCANIYSEAEAVCVDICKRVMNGEKYGEMAVLMRDTKTYEGVIDAAMRRYGIPYYLSNRPNISGMHLIRFIEKVYQTLIYGSDSSDLLNIAKSGYIDLTMDEETALTCYVEKWNPRNLSAYRNIWTKNVLGYSAKVTEESEKTLKYANSAREKIYEVLSRFYTAIMTSKTPREHATALYDFLMYLNIPEKLVKESEFIKQNGNLSESRRIDALWKAICSTLDTTVMTEQCLTECDAEDYLQLFRLAVSEVSLGTIPTSLDEVLIGDAEKVRPHMAKTVYIMGANDGVFPASVPDDGIFTESEKTILSALECKFHDTLDIKVSNELYCFYTALCRPTTNLVITYAAYQADGHESDKSGSLKEVERLFNNFKENSYEKSDQSDLIWRKRPAYEKASRGKGRIYEIIREIMEEDEEYKDSFEYSGIDISSDECTIEQALALECFNEKFEISHSKLESFMDCHFQFMCKYVLNLSEEPGKADFDARNVGLLIHSILENVAQFAAGGMDDDNLKIKISDAAEEYMVELTGKEKENQPPDIRHTVDFIVRQSLKFAQAIREEFTNSGYQPSDFELKIGKNSKIKPMKIEKEGTNISLQGIIDRVDTFEDGEGNVYVRVIDYKKSNKKFDPEKAKLGINDQMLLYLFSIWENGSEYYGGKKIIPGGVCYVETKPNMRIKDSKETVNIQGMTLDDEKSQKATNQAFAPKKNKKTIDEMNELKSAIVESIFKNVDEMKSGAAQASPKKEGNEDRKQENCIYCNYRSICRKRIRNFEED